MKKLLFSILFATCCFVAAHAQQFGDWEIVCWDSAGVTIPVQVRVSTANSNGALIRTFYRFTPGALVKVVPTVGTIGYCGNSRLDTVIVRLDSIVQNTTEPQQCECLYRIDLENHVASMPANSSRPRWDYDQVIVRDCGAGEEEILRIPTTSYAPRLWHMLGTSGLVDGASVFDSMRVQTTNPVSSFRIYLSPEGVKANYPALAIDTSRLRYSIADSADMADALETVINYACNKWASDNSLASPQREFAVLPSIGNQVFFYWYLINEPSGPYVNVSFTAGRIYYHRTSGGALQTGSFNFTGSGLDQEHEYITPCGLVCDVGYEWVTANTLDNRDDIDTIHLVFPIDVARYDSTSQICPGPCPEGDGCVEICNDESNPVPVHIVTLEGDCAVQDVAEFPLSLTSATGSLPANRYHSVSIATTGTVIITATNGTASTSATFSAGQTYSVSAKDCQLLQTSFTINATSGSAVVSTIR